MQTLSNESLIKLRVESGEFPSEWQLSTLHLIIIIMGKWTKCKDWLLLCVTFLLVACSYPVPDYSDWDMTQEMRDSLQFLSEHHYSTN